MAEDGTMTCYWVMPHEESCQVSLQNLGDQPVRVTATTEGSVYDWTDRSMHFHATWHQLTKVDTGPNKDQTGKGAFDVNYVTVEGQGKIVGDTLTIFNGVGGLVGEKETRRSSSTAKSFLPTWVRGQRITMDMPGAAREYFQSPFHAQPCGSGNFNVGFTVNSRYRVLDTLPFTKSIKFDMELWHWRHTQMNYAPSVFWYAGPGRRAA